MNEILLIKIRIEVVFFLIEWSASFVIWVVLKIYNFMLFFSDWSLDFIQFKLIEISNSMRKSLL